MEEWAKVVTEDGKAIYLNPTTGKFFQDMAPPPQKNWEEFKSMEEECDKKKRKKSRGETRGRPN